MKRILIFLIAVVALSTSCKKYLDDAYKNPNLPTYSPPEQVLQSCISGMHRGIAFDSRNIGFYTQNFAQITGKYSLSCKHCHSETAELTRFVSVIRKKCSKNNNGLYKDISVPKTCDHQTMQNNKRYSYYNDIQKAPSKEIIVLIKSNNTDLFNNTRRKYTKRIK